MSPRSAVLALAAALALGHPAAGLPGTEDPDRLADAVDVDLGGAPLFNTLPVRRLALTGANAEKVDHLITVAWVLVPSLEVMPVEQTYTALGTERVGFSSNGFSTEIVLDQDGYVLHYPGLADRREPQAP